MDKQTSAQGKGTVAGASFLLDFKAKHEKLLEVLFATYCIGGKAWQSRTRQVIGELKQCALGWFAAAAQTD